MEKHIYTVSSLTREIKDVIESSFPPLWVEGEISNFKRHSSGHLYFSMKDESAQIRCVMWRFQAGELLFRPDDGMKVLVEAELQVYERGGQYQLIVRKIHPAGVGELQLAFEQIKQRLYEEGLFDDQRKIPIPPYPERVGIITSPTGAAIRDVLSVMTRRFPAIQLILYPVRVQGDAAPEEIARALKDFNIYNNVDVIIVTRGGGSLEDLWAFNEEIVARAIFASEIPVISAVGHEVDYSIADFVADKRAPTPSAAAEMVVKDRQEILGIVAYFQEKMTTTLIQKIQAEKEKITNYEKSYAFRRAQDTVFQKAQRLDEISRNVQLALTNSLKLNSEKIRNIHNRLQALNPNEVLKRGYSICFKDNEVVKDIRQIHPGDIVRTKLWHGGFTAQVQELGDE